MEGLSKTAGHFVGRGTFLADKTLPHYRGSRGPPYHVDPKYKANLPNTTIKY